MQSRRILPLPRCGVTPVDKTTQQASDNDDSLGILVNEYAARTGRAPQQAPLSACCRARMRRVW